MQTITQVEQSEAADEARRNFFELARSFNNAMLVTHAPDDLLHARPMRVVRIDDDGDLWFVTGVETVKIDELVRAPSALVTMQAPHRFASVTGTVAIVRNPVTVADLWSDSFRAYWKSPTDPNIALIHLMADAAEYWDDSGAAGVRWAFRATKAVLSGTTLKDDEDDDVGLHGHVKL